MQQLNPFTTLSLTTRRAQALAAEDIFNNVRVPRQDISIVLRKKVVEDACVFSLQCSQESGDMPTSFEPLSESEKLLHKVGESQAQVRMGA